MQAMKTPSIRGRQLMWIIWPAFLVAGVAELTFFLGTETLFPLFGLPPRLDAAGNPAAV